MLDFAAALLAVVVIVLVCRILLGMRLLTSITAGLVGGWVLSGLLLCARGGFEDFDSEQLAERRMSHSLLSTLALLFLVVNLAVGAHRETRRRSSR